MTRICYGDGAQRLHPLGAAIAVLGLALIANDGILALIALAFAIGAGSVVFTTLL